MVTDMLHRVRDYLAQPGKSKAGLAQKAGLHPNTLRDADKSDWNPTADTLLKIEALFLIEDMAAEDGADAEAAAA